MDTMCGRIGGDAELSPDGDEFARRLADWVRPGPGWSNNGQSVVKGWGFKLSIADLHSFLTAGCDPEPGAKHLSI